MKQQQITYDKGITYVPSDALCSDNALSECMGMTYENGEMKPIQKAEDKFSFQDLMNEELIHVHQLPSTGKNYITTNGQTLYYFQGNDVQTTQLGTFEGTLKSIESIGNTLIVSTSKSIYYYLWKGTSYSNIGNKIPEPKVSFKLVNKHEVPNPQTGIDDVVYETVESWMNVPEGVIDTGARRIDDQETYNNIVWGLYAKNEMEAKKKGAFTRPFFLRYALRLYDDEYTYMSQPILALPSTYENAYFFWGNGELRCRTHTAHLYFKMEQDYSDWTDIVSGVDLFVTDQADLYDSSLDAVYEYMSSLKYWEGIGATENHSQQVYETSRHLLESESVSSYFRFIPNNDDYSIKDQLVSLSVFYLISHLGITSSDEYSKVPINHHALVNLTTQTFLSNDDYYSRAPLSAGYMKSYNQRLNLTDVKRGFFDGFSNFILYDYTSYTYSWAIVVHIETSSGTKSVEKQVTSSRERMLHYFYYPDPRAKEVDIYDLTNEIKYDTIKLTEHPGLNGAYFLSLPPDEIEDNYTQAQDPQISDPAPEELPNMIITSEVNNPFVFRASGYNSIGTGKILGMATQTVALSEGQHGAFPLMVFSTDGIWALAVSNTGLYTASNPMQREVCSNPKSITETDGAVYFVSKKGLMVIVGNNVKCVSEQLDGKVFSNSTLPQITDGDFKGFLNGCFIAYDYRDSQLLIINPSKTFHWVYNMKSGTFAKMSQNNNYIKTVVNDYPDNLIQETGGDVYSLLNKPDENADQSSYSGIILTRPMKLENGLSLKTIMDLKNVFTMDGTITLYIYGSNNCENWMEVTSLTGVPWKYYRFKIVFSNMKATDRFSGTVLVTQERRTNKLR